VEKREGFVISEEEIQKAIEFNDVAGTITRLMAIAVVAHRKDTRKIRDVIMDSGFFYMLDEKHGGEVYPSNYRDFSEEEQDQLNDVFHWYVRWNFDGNMVIW
jgi:hypothetical protein